MGNIINKNRLRDILYNYGLRNTQERYVILEQIYKEDDSFSATDIYNSIFEFNNSISLATVYNTFSLFMKIGIIEEIPTTGIGRLFKVCNKLK